MVSTICDNNAALSAKHCLVNERRVGLHFEKWMISQTDRLRYERVFDELRVFWQEKTSLPGLKLKQFFSLSNLRKDVLRKVWDVADFNKKGCLERENFVIAAHLLERVLKECNDSERRINFISSDLIQQMRSNLSPPSHFEKDFFKHEICDFRDNEAEKHNFLQHAHLNTVCSEFVNLNINPSRQKTNPILSSTNNPTHLNSISNDELKQKQTLRYGLSKQVNKLQSKLSQVDEHLSSCKSEKKTLTEQLLDTNTLRDELDRTVSELNKSIESMQTYISKITPQYDLICVNSSLQVLRSRVDGLKSTYADHCLKIDKTKEAATGKHEAIKSIQTQLRHIVSSNEMKREEISKLREQMLTSKAQNEASCAKKSESLPKLVSYNAVSDYASSNMMTPSNSMLLSLDGESLARSNEYSLATTEDSSTLSDATPSSTDSLPREIGNNSLDERPDADYAVVAIRGYEPASDAELDFSVGDKIRVDKCHPDGWWQGKIISSCKDASNVGKFGYFPSTFTANVLQKPAYTIAICDFVAHSKEELSFVKGDTLLILSAPADDNGIRSWRLAAHANSLDTLGLVPSNHLANGTEAYEEVKNDSYSTVNYEECNEKTYAELNAFATNSLVPEPPLVDRLVQRKTAIQELLITEERYGCFISSLIHFMNKHFRPNSGADALLDYASEWPVIFLNWYALRDSSKELLLHCNRKLSGVCRQGGVGLALKTELPKLREIYVQFFSRQNNALRFIQSKKQNCEKFRAALQSFSMEKKMRCGLETAFIRPMERITRYPLLIKRILSLTEITSSEYTYLEESAAQAEQLCRIVNEELRASERRDRLTWCEENINFSHNSNGNFIERISFLSPTNIMGSRKLLFEGSLSKSRSGKELVAFLFNDMFLLCTVNSVATLKSSFSFSSSLWRSQKLTVYKEAWRLDRIRATAVKSKTINKLDANGVQSREEALSDEFFVYISNGATFKLKASNRIECQAWITQLQSAVRNYLYVTERSRCRDVPMFFARHVVLTLCVSSAVHLPFYQKQGGAVGGFKKNKSVSKPLRCSASLENGQKYCTVPMDTEYTNASVCCFWNEKFVFYFSTDELEEGLVPKIRFNITERRIFRPDEKLASAVLEFRNLLQNANIERDKTPVYRLPLCFANQNASISSANNAALIVETSFQFVEA